ncbi:MAG: heat-shock protein Hsp20 [Dehalococcoidia bacterium]|jgi:HSP20 family protein|nr:MAG: heat-shock protein Hsp20 [Dehalococcoidia bacterium]
MVTRWDPWRELAQMRSQMDRMLEDAFSSSGARYDITTPATDVFVGDDELRVTMALPAVNPADVEITTTPEALIIRGESKASYEEKNGRWARREIAYGRFGRAIALPFGVDADHATAHFENGLLTVRLPKAEAERPRRIHVTTSSSAIDTTASKPSEAAEQPAASASGAR